MHLVSEWTDAARPPSRSLRTRERPRGCYKWEHSAASTKLAAWGHTRICGIQDLGTTAADRT